MTRPWLSQEHRRPEPKVPTLERLFLRCSPGAGATDLLIDLTRNGGGGSSSMNSQDRLSMRWPLRTQSWVRCPGGTAA